MLQKGQSSDIQDKDNIKELYKQTKQNKTKLNNFRRPQSKLEQLIIFISNSVAINTLKFSELTGTG